MRTWRRSSEASRPRVGSGPRAYLRPGAAFAGGTLARDIAYLTQIGEREGVPTLLLGAVRGSNDEHRRWALRTVQSLVDPSDGLDGHVIGVWGLVYKQGPTPCGVRARSSSAGS